MKLQAYLIMFVAMMVFLEFLGLPTGFSLTLDTFGININPITHELESADLQNSNFFSQIFGTTAGALTVLVLSGVGAIIVGLFARSYDTSLVILPLVISVAGLFASTGLVLLQYADTLGQTWITALIATIFLPLGVGFVWSCVDYFAGR
jgi:hypothetical protein